NFGQSGVWRWSASTGWGKLTGLEVGYYTVADSDAFFGNFDTGSKGTWRWTPTAGWSLLSPAQGDIFCADAAGDLVVSYLAQDIGASLAGTWRWNAIAGWARLSSAAPNNLVVSANGAIYENRGTGGLWYLGVSQSAFTQISTSSAIYSYTVP